MLQLGIPAGETHKGEEPIRQTLHGHMTNQQPMRPQEYAIFWLPGTIKSLFMEHQNTKGRSIMNNPMAVSSQGGKFVDVLLLEAKWNENMMYV